MSLTVIGLNHQTAPLRVRERLAFPAEMLGDAVRTLIDSQTATEAMILSTCNRTELYCVGDGDEVVRWLALYHNLGTSEIAPYLYRYTDKQAVQHAFRVACGLDSMVLGEPQILGQLKEAVHVAQQQLALHSELNALFQKTFAMAKDVRTRSAVGENSVSMAAASVKMAEQIFPSIDKLNVLLVGAGEMIELVATYFAAKSPKRITVLNRTLARAQELSAQLDAPAADAGLLTALPEMLPQYDVVVSSTASPLPLIGKGLVERALKLRRGMPMFLLDLAVPSDIEVEVANLDDAYLYTVDDMMGIVQSGKAARAKAAQEAESMVDEKVAEFLDWQEARQAVPMIRALRDEGEKARRYVLENAMKQLHKGLPPEQVLERLSHQLTNKLLHAPTRTLNKDSQHNPDLADAINRIYHLDEHTEQR